MIRFKKDGDPTESVIVDYTNYKGVRELRHITPTVDRVCGARLQPIPSRGRFHAGLLVSPC
jgi:hypothetical protein